MFAKVVRKILILESDLDNTHDTFHRAIRPFIVVGQLFGIFPIAGIFSNNARHVRVDWFSVRVILNLVIIGAGSFNMITEIQRLRTIGISAKNINHLVFLIDACLISTLFLRMATQWQRVAIKWSQVDKIFLSESYRICSWWTLKRKIWFTAGLLLLLACGEHILSIVNTLSDQQHEIRHCGWEQNVTDMFRHFALRKFANVYSYFPYSSYSAGFFMFVSSALTLYWNYLDIFIILLSIAIATRFNQIHKHIQTIAQGVFASNEQFWIRVRSDYVSVCELLDEVDRVVSWIMLISCATNLYFICLQILNVSQKLRYVMNDVYYCFSLLFLIGRTVTMFLCAASIHEAAKKPLDVVTKIPNSGWCVELDRFATQLKSETVALSGMGFFHITRQLLFSMAGTIVTYELVMLKFDRQSEGKGYIRPCSFFEIEKKWLTGK
ncbi:gustatory receptor for sugar taste 64a-like [Toxorhynchites rutilus septentrionalis]|uniref:gustatory receptor for sugar taste 64a-like n=1 Tax=Toxorhynchites rutilus septentrionalis TaxID=329112 RepID=UPI002478E331|nr:gustatory receptor for sugar taste 64a-like [Toxorhynchites rutilus septentrionalis]